MRSSRSGRPSCHRQFGVVAFLQDAQVERNRLREKAHVVTILLAVPLQLGERDVVRVESHHAEVPIGARKHLCQAVLIIFRDSGNRDAVEVNAVLVMKRTTLKGQVHKRARCFTRRKLDYVQVGGGTFEPVELRHDKTTDAIHPHRCVDSVVQLLQERVPRTWRLSAM